MTDEAALMSTPISSKQTRDAVQKGGLEAVDVAYGNLKTHLEKSLFLLAEGEMIKCAVCDKRVDQRKEMVVVCTEDDCRAASHMKCLSSQFLSGQEMKDPMIPTEGQCPTCKTKIRWVDLMKEMTLRIRGEKEVEKLMKKPRERRAEVAKRKQISSDVAASLEVGMDDEEDFQADEEDATGGLHAADVAGATFSDDGWQYRADEDDDTMSFTSVDSDLSQVFHPGSPCKSRLDSAGSELIIEESDWDYAEVLC